MTSPPQNVPSETDATHLVTQLLGVQPLQVVRFRTGLVHFVYKATLPNQQHVVVRMAANSPGSLHGMVYWSQWLQPLALPLPTLLADDRQARHTPFPAVVLNYMPGNDLGHVYHTLSTEQKHALAAELAHIQQRVATLPHGPGYGYAVSYEDPVLLPTWGDVVARSLTRSFERIAAFGRFDVAAVEQVRALLPTFATYFANVPATPFLDDTTTKNVLIHAGKLSGIVDVDCVCFGDPLYTVALTQMALLSMQADRVYTDAWCDALKLDTFQRRVRAFYTCLFCVDFFSELGLAANQNNDIADEQPRIEQLLRIFQELLAEMNALDSAG